VGRHVECDGAVASLSPPPPPPPPSPSSSLSPHFSFLTCDMIQDLIHLRSRTAGKGPEPWIPSVRQVKLAGPPDGSYDNRCTQSTGDDDAQHLLLRPSHQQRARQMTCFRASAPHENKLSVSCTTSRLKHVRGRWIPILDPGSGKTRTRGTRRRDEGTHHKPYRRHPGA
jgi:hypothetical protein